MVTCNVITPHLFWFKKIRTNMVIVFFISIAVNIGMWFERFVIIVTSLHRDYLPSSWGMFQPTIWDLMTFFGTIGLFVTFIFVFLRLLPMISIFEVRTLLPQSHVTEETTTTVPEPAPAAGD